MTAVFEFTVNRKPVRIETDADRPLLEVLREELGLTGTKYGCGESECGACSVLISGSAVRTCVTNVSEVQGKEITTIQGLERDGKLHPVQQAFLEKQGMQCGYCVPGQIMNAVALLNRIPSPTREQVVQGMSGNICRCCNYSKILDSVVYAATLAKETV